jgi:stearoyl-CoA desaturase (Delta-9 desaturase)
MCTESKEFFSKEQCYIMKHQKIKSWLIHTVLVLLLIGLSTTYTVAHSRLGIGILLVFNIIVFGWIGAIIWGIQMLWIPFWAAGVVNGIGHWWGYRNGETKDRSRNIVPWGIVIGGEELHNNHHLDPASARLSRRWFEFDIGWMYIRLLSALRLATVK